MGQVLEVGGEVILSRRDLSKLPSIPHAELPAVYETAKAAITKCDRIDECKDWADKMAALGSYARQSHDDSLRKMAERIQARAIRRVGELMNELAPAGREAPRKLKTVSVSGMGTHTTSKNKLAAAAGISRNQMATATKVANVPEREFNSAVESDDPPTITELAAIGNKKNSSVPDHLNGINPEHFKLSTQAQGTIRRFVDFASATDPIEIVSGSHDREKQEILKNSAILIDWLGRLCMLLQAKGNQ